jgi:hypothetical protein
MTISEDAAPMPTYKEWMAQAANAGQDLVAADLAYTALINGMTATQRRMLVQNQQLARNSRDENQKPD